MKSVVHTSLNVALLPEEVGASSKSNLPLPTSPFRTVFQTNNEMRQKFVNFLTTIFYQLDEKKVLAAMDQILESPDLTEQQIYEQLVSRIDDLKRRFPILDQIRSLGVLKKGMGEQARELLAESNSGAFQDYAEIYFGRYVGPLQSNAKLPLKKSAIRVANNVAVTLQDRIEAGKLFYPYTGFAPLNDPDCTSPDLEPEKTHKPLGSEIEDQSLDLIACLGGLHHIPPDRVVPFVESIHAKLRPGAVFLLRDHDVVDEKTSAIVSVVHSFVNAAAKQPWAVESKEIRNWKSMEEWTHLIETSGFQRKPKQPLVLSKDPTQNGMIAFVKRPTDLSELQQSMLYVKNASVHMGRSYATWVEWGNVRYAKDYARFIQDHHAYAFDYMGHLGQHWTHFRQYLKACKEDNISLKEVIFSDGFTMNAFILFTAMLQCSVSHATNVPSRLLARWRFGDNWRDVAHLTELEKYLAAVEKEYSEFIDETPFYHYPYLSKIGGIWNAACCRGGLISRVSSAPTAFLGTIDLLLKSAISLPVRAVFSSEKNKEPETVKILVKDPDHKIDLLIQDWNQNNPTHPIETLLSTTEGDHRALSVPRYRPFTQLCQLLAEAETIELIEISGQKSTSIDFLVASQEAPLESEPAYVLDELQGSEPGRKYYTYKLPTPDLLNALRESKGKGAVHYIHE